MKSLISAGPATALAVTAIILLAAPGRACRADLLTFSPVPNSPTVVGENGTLSYNSTTHVFLASVLEPNAVDPNFLSLQYASAATSPIPFTPTFLDPDVTGTASLVLDLRVDNSGHFLANGSGVTLTGGIDFNGDGIDDVSSGMNNPLLTGTIVGFGSAPAGPPTVDFDGLFQVTGGLLTQMITLSNNGGTLPPEFRIGSLGGFNLSAESVNSGILGDFQSSFSSSSVKGDLELAAAPEPGAWFLTLSGLAVIGAVAGLRRAGTPEHFDLSRVGLRRSGSRLARRLVP